MEKAVLFWVEDGDGGRRGFGADTPAARALFELVGAGEGSPYTQVVLERRATDAILALECPYTTPHLDSLIRNAIDGKVGFIN